MCLFVELISTETPRFFLQPLALKHVFTAVSLEAFSEESKGLHPADICQWNSSQEFLANCWDDTLIAFAVEKKPKIGNFAIAFFPQVMRRVVIKDCTQSFVIDVRHLPRDVTAVDMSDNAIKGTPDLAELPIGLKRFIMRHNRLTGSIHFCRLPSNIRVIDLAYNRIDQREIYYDELPVVLECIDLNWNTRISDIFPVSEEVSDTMKFIGVPGDQIH